jgi:hypothetical protein
VTCESVFAAAEGGRDLLDPTVRRRMPLHRGA